MKYKFRVDENNYIVDFWKDENGIEVPEDEVMYLPCYRFIDGELICDEEAKQRYIDYLQSQAKAEEIARLKQELASTDYLALKYAEGWFTDEQYELIKATREELREQIRALENENI